jgi:hypothetical protein
VLNISATAESASEYLRRIKLEFRDSNSQRYEIEATRVILTVAPRHVRVFAGFKGNGKGERPIFSWDWRWAVNLREEEAADVAHVLRLFGLETEMRPSLSQTQAEEAF